jgi:AbrB family looped-hinge helix DNA binding protein
MRITSKGQVTIPVEIREKAGLLPGTEVDFELADDSVRIVRARAPKGETRGQRAVRLLRGQRHRQDVDRRDHGLDSWRGLSRLSSIAT